VPAYVILHDSTLDEIARWSVMHDADKRAVIAALSQREKTKMGSDPCG